MSDESKQKSETPFEKFREFTRKIVAVPKEKIDRREKAYKKARAKLKHKPL